MKGWRVERLESDAASLHGRDALADPRREVSVLEVTEPALVLGSTQRDDIVDVKALERREVQLIRRRTGGGAVYLVPGEHVWVDLTIPAGDPLWRDDIAHAFTWLGEVWAGALAEIGVPDVVVNDVAVCHSVLGRLICFAGLGFGEVSGRGGKLVGLSQRRTRAGAWFQTVLMRRWDATAYARMLGPGLRRVADDPTTAIADVRVQTVDVDSTDLVDALTPHFPA